MKNVILKRLSFVNFKGIRELTIEFNEGQTSVFGMNGTGKTTVFDGFTWLLFGKDSRDRKSFDLKTLDENGIAIPKLPHEVSAILIVDGEEISLCRRYNEKWQKKRGSVVEEFNGHEEERLYNDVPCSLKDWNEKIAAICSEQSFKFITNPLYFSAQKVDVQRAMLFRMAGEISDAEIAEGNQDFTQLLSNLTGKNLEEYKKEISAKKRRIKTEIDGIPERIDERKRDSQDAENWDAIEKEISSKKDELAEIDALITDKAKAYNAANDKRMKTSQELADIRSKKSSRESAIRQTALSSYYKEKEAQQELQMKVRNNENEAKRLRDNIQNRKNALAKLASEREKLLNEWRSIKARTINFNEDDFICPTCGRRFEVSEIESKQEEMTAKFNAKNADDLRINNEKGQEIKAQREKLEVDIATDEKRLSEIEEIIAIDKGQELFSKTLTEPEYSIDGDSEYESLCQKESELADALNAPIELPDDAELKEQKKSLSAEIEALRSRISKREAIERNNKRIAELEESYKNQSQELADLESIEFTISAFSKARIEAVESRINGMFSLVKFKMFEQQINGGEIETCEAMANGRPYSTQNNAMCINMGIDIINAICKHEGITAPIFIDNAESVNQLIPTDSQVIRLVVTESDSALRIQ